MSATVTSQQRFTKRRPCPICGGWEALERGKGKRCVGFASADGEWVRCSREEHAGNLAPEDSGAGPVFVHRMRGACKCGVEHNPDNRVRDEIEAVYPYQDERRELLYEVVRKVGKRFLQRKPDGAGGWTWKVNGARRVIYRLPELLEDDGDRPVYIVEGEKDADALWKRGHVATCNPGGARKWKPVADVARTALRGRDVIVIADKDDVGREHAREVEASLRDVVRSIRVVECPKGKDVSDHLAAGGALDELVSLLSTSDLPRPVDVFGPDGEGATADATDVRNAERLVELHGDDLRWVGTWKRGLAWDGRRWTLDSESRWQLAAIMTSRTLLAEARASNDEDALEWAKASQDAKRIVSMQTVAKAAPRIVTTHQKLDADPWLLNVANGTIDLRTGELRPHRRDDMLTKLAPVTYDPQATCPRFDRFLGEVFAGDEDLVTFVHRYLGYCLTGDVREHVLAFWHGPGGNGKGVLGGIMLQILGDYAAKAAPDLLFRSEHAERHPTELADLHGRRLIICNETTRGRAWDEGTVKDVTGGDAITARRMREDFWSFAPTHKIVVWGNVRPTIRVVDDAMRRRLRLVPFAVSFVGREDKTLPETLQAEVSGILRWLVQGCLDWQREGLPKSSAVEDATAGYLRDEDVLGQFFAEECVLEAAARVTRQELRERYEAWAEERGDSKPVGAKAFTAAVRTKGATEKRLTTAKGKRNGWLGIRLATDADHPEPGEQADLYQGRVTT